VERFVNGVIAGALGLTTLAAGMISVNFLGRSAAARRIAATGGEHTTAHAIMLVL
jgi:hypothetical protein